MRKCSFCKKECRSGFCGVECRRSYRPSYSRRSKESYKNGAIKMSISRMKDGSYKWTDDMKKRSRLTHTGRKQPWCSENISKLMQSLRINKGSQIERRVGFLLDRMLYTMIPQFKIKTKSKTTLVDYCNAFSDILIFIDGCYWHGCPLPGHCNSKNKDLKYKRDRDLDEELKSEGWSIIRIWEHELKFKKDFKMDYSIREVLKNKIRNLERNPIKKDHYKEYKENWFRNFGYFYDDYLENKKYSSKNILPVEDTISL